MVKMIQVHFFMKIKFFMISMLFFVACSQNIKKIVPYEDFSTKPTVTIKNFESSYKDYNKIKFLIRAPLMEKWDIYEKIVFPNGINLILFDDKTDTVVNLNCDYAENYLKNRLWIFKNNVEIVSKQGGFLKTSELYFSEAENKIYSLKIVELTDNEGNKIVGKDGFEANINFTYYEFKNVEGILRTPVDSLINF